MNPYNESHVYKYELKKLCSPGVTLIVKQMKEWGEKI